MENIKGYKMVLTPECVFQTIKMKSKLNRFSKNKNYLCLLSNCKNKLRRAIVSNSNREQIYSVCECILNVSNGNVKLSKDDFAKLKKYNKNFKSLPDLLFILLVHLSRACLYRPVITVIVRRHQVFQYFNIPVALLVSKIAPHLLL